MDIEKLIMDTFTAHEDITPDGDEVYADVRRRIDRRRVLSRPLAVAAGVVVLSLAAVTAVVLTRSGAPTDNVQVADQGPTTPVNTAPVEPAIKDLTMPYSLDWLPPGEVDYLARRVNIGGSAAHPEVPVYNGEYMMTVTNNGQVLDVDVQEMKMSDPDEAAFKSGPGASVTIKGRHGVESKNNDGPGGYELYLEHPDGGSLYVGVAADLPSGSTATAQQLVDIGRRVAENVRFPGDTAVTPTFGLRDLPAGLKVCSWDVEKGFGRLPDGKVPNTRYDLGTCDVQPTINVGTGGPDSEGGTPGQPVQGHETKYADDQGYLRLFVMNAVNGEAVVIAGKVPLDNLYAIANSLVLPS